jgi:hypothetical protein
MSINNTAFLNSVLTTVKGYLHNYAQQANFSENMGSVFGNQANLELITSLAVSWQQGDYRIIPPIEILSSEQLNGANGAYSQDNQTIYLSAAIINQQNVDLAARTLLEEIGHRIDGLVNVADTPGDEGAMFLELVLSGGG